MRYEEDETARLDANAAAERNVVVTPEMHAGRQPLANILCCERERRWVPCFYFKRMTHLIIALSLPGLWRRA